MYKKTNSKMAGVNPITSIVTFNANELNTLNKKV